MAKVSEHQTEFDETYISSTEICEKLGIHKTSVSNAIKSGFLPAPIVIANRHVHLWRRNELTLILEHWKASLERRRRVAV